LLGEGAVLGASGRRVFRAGRIFDNQDGYQPHTRPAFTLLDEGELEEAVRRMAAGLPPGRRSGRQARGGRRC
jgi:hypothetical protein